MDADKINETLKDFLTPLQAAGKLRVGKRAVIYACERGQLPGAMLLAGRWFIPPAAVAVRLKIHGKGQIPQAARNYPWSKPSPDKDLGPRKKSRRKSPNKADILLHGANKG